MSPTHNLTLATSKILNYNSLRLKGFVCKTPFLAFICSLPNYAIVEDFFSFAVPKTDSKQNKGSLNPSCSSDCICFVTLFTKQRSACAYVYTTKVTPTLLLFLIIFAVNSDSQNLPVLCQSCKVLKFVIQIHVCIQIRVVKALVANHCITVTVSTYK